MKVIVSAGAKFWAFNMAEQLESRGHLQRLLTSYHSKKYPFLPRLRLDHENITPNKIKSFLLPSILIEIWKRIPWTRKFQSILDAGSLFDQWASKQLEPCDIVVPFATHALETLEASKKMGAITVLERASAHIQYEANLLSEEYERWGVDKKTHDPKSLKRQLEEYQRADYIMVPSTYAKNTFNAQGVSPKKVKMCPFGVDLRAFQQLQKADDVFRVIFVGHCSLGKGIPYLLQAFHELKLKNAELRLIGSVSDDIHNTFAKHQGLFKYFPTMPQSKLSSHYSQGSVFVFPSISDGFGLVLTQAMACGLPIIATQNTGAPDLIEEQKEGFIVPIRDVDALKERIHLLYSDPNLRAQMARAAQERAKQLWTWETYGFNISKIYESILKEQTQTEKLRGVTDHSHVP